MLKNKKGVSLMEVMVVCVIVAILGLAGIGIYEYQVEKTTATNGFNMIRKIVDVEIAYRMENKEWCLSFDELPVKIEGEIDEGSAVTRDFVYSLDSEDSSTSSVTSSIFSITSSVSSATSSITSSASSTAFSEELSFS